MKPAEKFWQWGRLLQRCAASAVLCVLLAPAPAQAFWLLGFAPAQTISPGTLGFISGTGGQFSRVGDPAKSSFTPSLAHAGLRLGLTDRLDVGYRLCTVPLPFNSVGPSLGSEIDAKFRLTNPEDRWQTSFVLSGAYAYLAIAGQSKNAWSPGADVVLSREMNRRLNFFSELRYVYTAIPSAPQGANSNYVHAFGPAVGAKFSWTSEVAVVPEIGVFNFQGRLAGKAADGFAAQYGVVFSVSGLPKLW